MNQRRTTILNDTRRKLALDLLLDIELEILAVGCLRSEQLARSVSDFYGRFWTAEFDEVARHLLHSPSIADGIVTLPEALKPTIPHALAEHWDTTLNIDQLTSLVELAIPIRAALLTEPHPA